MTFCRVRAHRLRAVPFFESDFLCMTSAKLQGNLPRGSRARSCTNEIKICSARWQDITTNTYMRSTPDVRLPARNAISWLYLPMHLPQKAVLRHTKRRTCHAKCHQHTRCVGYRDEMPGGYGPLQQQLRPGNRDELIESLHNKRVWWCDAEPNRSKIIQKPREPTRTNFHQPLGQPPRSGPFSI